MNQPAKSYEKVHYEYRPAKQVERRMLLDTFQKLMKLGFPISDYQYTGLGSIYFIDFIMFHKYLGIQKMYSIESSPNIDKRVKFNKPFKLVNIEMEDIANYIPKLSIDLQHILWLDYDHILTEKIINTIVLACSQLSPGSIFLVTLDIEPPGEPQEGPDEWKKHFFLEAENYLLPKYKAIKFSRSKLPEINASIIKQAISEGLLGRKNVSFIPLFNFLYADGHQMISLGGMIGSEDHKQKTKILDKQKLPFLRNDIVKYPYKIRVPLVTRKERLYLDSAMPCNKNWKPKEFELKKKEIEDYRKIYKYYPAYTEMFL
ncbi:MAG: hypothetical protein CMD96_02325 [Gammaproteobacteria bacterium]|nr:hypothetical protein [Gammaproteobacteria bacterium]